MTRNAVFHDSGSFDDGTPIAVFPSAITSVFGRTGVVAAAAGDYFGAVPAALTGATQAARFVGATASGAPASGTFAVGDVVVARDGKVWVCTSAGTPGTWADVGGGASVSYATPSIALGLSAAAGAASTVIRSDSTIAAFDATSPTTQAFGDSAAVGSAAFAARRDHKHAMPALGTGASDACAGNDARLSDSRAPNGTAGGDLNGSYPNPLVDVGLFGGVAWTTVTKAGDEGVFSNTVLQADDELFFTAASGGIYEFSACIIYVSTAGAGTPDIKFAFGEDATARGILQYFGFSSADANTTATAGTINNATGLVLGTAATNRVFSVIGSFLGAGGTFGFYFCQNTSGTNATTVKAGSVLRYRRVL